MSQTSQDRLRHPSLLHALLRFWAEWQLLVLFAAGCLSVLLAAGGLWAQARQTSEPVSAGKIAYQILKLFTVQLDEPKPPVPMALDIARFLGPAVLGYTTLAAFAVLLRGQWQLVRLRLSSGHVVICGLGRKGLCLCRSFIFSGEQVVIIEGDEDNKLIPPAREAGALVLVGDAGDPGLLHRAGIARARHLLAVTGDDGKNVEIALHAAALLPAQASSERERVIALIHIINPELRALFRRQRVFLKTKDRLDARVFDFYENCVRELFDAAPLDRLPIRKSDTHLQVHLLIVGFGHMGESLLMQALRIGHYANGCPLRVTVIDPEAARSQRRLFQRFPAVEQLCAIEFITGETEEVNVLDRINHPLTGMTSVITVAICIGDDAQTLSLALGLLPLARQNGIPIVARMHSHLGLATLLEPGPATSLTSEHIRPFGMVEDLCEPDTLLEEKLDGLARAIHKAQTKSGTVDEHLAGLPADVPWEKLDEDYRDSCRQQADHIPVKLRACGYIVTKASKRMVGVTEFKEAEVEIMAEMEHRRHCAECRLAEWQPGAQGAGGSAEPSRWLVPWGELPEKIKERNRQSVRAVPQLLAAVGKSIARAENSNVS